MHELPNLKIATENYSISQIDVQRTIEEKFKRGFSYFTFFCISPYFLLLFICIWMASLFQPTFRKYLYSKFLSHYLRLFFTLTGLLSYSINETIHPTYTTPPLILTTRINLIQALFIYQLFDYPILVPINPRLITFHSLEYLPFWCVKSMIKTISYSDGSLPENFSNIQTLLSKGYPIVVYFNHITCNPFSNHNLYIFSKLLDLLKLDKDIYFLRTENLERIRLSQLGSPTMIPIDLIKKEALFRHIPDHRHQEMYRALAFFYHVENWRVFS